MSYQVLARKWRPQRFEDMVGQEHVLQALMNALNTERLHHAYLFTGTRGVGKTTVARLVAKGLNCEQGVTATPCGQCSSCLEIEQGNFPDLIEVDAASRTKVEDTRDLLENVQYAPTRGRFKVYLIDEVHMLSSHSFNALLKTLEEPPPHVKFLLATTDPQKLPITILSRCLQFNLKRMSLAQIVEQLHKILQAESVQYEEGAIKPLAIAADGSMRDALSLLDQAIAYGNGQLLSSEVTAMLGTVNRDFSYRLLDLILSGDASAAISLSRELFLQGLQADTLLSELSSVLQAIALQQQAPDAVDELLFEREKLEKLANQAAPELVQLFYQMALQGRQEVALSPMQQSAFEMILLRMVTFMPPSARQAPVLTNEASEENVTAQKKNSKFAAGIAPSGDQPQSVNDASQMTAPAAELNAPTELETAKAPLTSDEVALASPAPHRTNTPAATSSEQADHAPVTGNAQTPDDTETQGQAASTEQIPLEAYQESLVANASNDQFDNPTQASTVDNATSVAFDRHSTTLTDSASPSDDHPQGAMTDVDGAQTQLESSKEVGDSDGAPDLFASAQAGNDLVPEVAAPPMVSDETKQLDVAAGEMLTIDNWSAAIERMALKGLAHQLARNSVVLTCLQEGDKIRCQLGMGSHQSQLKNGKMEQRVKQAIEAYLGLPVTLEYVLLATDDERLKETPEQRHQVEMAARQKAAEESFLSDEKVQRVVSRFSGTILENTIRPAQS